MNKHYKRRYYPTCIDIPAPKRTELIEVLNQTLAVTLDLKSQVKQAHWNIKGMDFYQLHLLFDEMATSLEEYIDLAAERITALGGEAMGTVRIAATHSMLPEYPFKLSRGEEHVAALAERFASYANLVRSEIDAAMELADADTADLYTEISRGIDKYLWFLEAHLQASPVEAKIVEELYTSASSIQS